MGILDIFTSKRESVHISADTSLVPRKLICYKCEQEIDERHTVEGCKKTGISRRFFFGLAGASAAALALRLEGIPIPEARYQVVARAGDMFEVETLNPFTIAWEGAKTKAGHPFKTDQGLVQDGGLLEFHGQDTWRPDMWLRVHRGLAEMNVLGIVDKTTGKQVKYRIVRNEDAEARVAAAHKRVMQDHEDAARAANARLTEARYAVDQELYRRSVLEGPGRALDLHIRNGNRHYWQTA